MEGGMLWVVRANHGFETIDAPFSQGSTRIVYAPFAELKWDGEGCASGEKTRRKLASAFKCLTVSDIADFRKSSSRQATPEEEEVKEVVVVVSGHAQLISRSSVVVCEMGIPRRLGLGGGFA